MSDISYDLPGAAEFIGWFGSWPSFHDAEVLDLTLSRSGPSTIRVYTFERTDLVDESGSYVRIKNVVVSLVFGHVTDLDLDGFSIQNVINHLTLSQSGEGYELTLEPCYGIAGTITGEDVRVSFDPGVPVDLRIR